MGWGNLYTVVTNLQKQCVHNSLMVRMCKHHSDHHKPGNIRTHKCLPTHSSQSFRQHFPLIIINKTKLQSYTWRFHICIKILSVLDSTTRKQKVTQRTAVCTHARLYGLGTKTKNKKNELCELPIE